VLSDASAWFDPDAIVLSASKGIENESLETMDEVMKHSLPGRLGARIAFLSGPSFAKEVGRNLPTAVVVASHDRHSADAGAELFRGERFRVYTSDDVTGVELGGALKNVMAIAAGIIDGMGLGHNTRAALITRGLAEISRLAVRKGANPLTLAGLAGMGDLILTCTGDLSRNRSVGVGLGQGKKLSEVLAAMTQVAEGVKTTKSAYDLSEKLGVEMPITRVIYQILYEDRPAQAGITELMLRAPKHELGEGGARRNTAPGALCISCIISSATPSTRPSSAVHERGPRFLERRRTFPARTSTVQKRSDSVTTLMSTGRAFLLRFLLCLVLPATLISRARGDALPPPATAPATPAAKSGDSLDFDLFGDKKPATPGVNLSLPPTTAPKPDSLMLAKQVKKRRLMLQLHQGFGFATLALLAATCVIGQLAYNDQFGGGTYTGKYLPYHEALAYTSTGTFAVTGLLGLIAPTPYKKPLKLDAALLHKVMMGVATAGFLAQIALGLATAYNGGELFQRDLALAHLVTGYTTFAAMTTGYLAFVF
jgi:glycerol-3-phosphate dehydrogenase (NAD(P)+)